MMGGKSSTIFLGDLARAICELGVKDPEAIKLVAAMLGFSVSLPLEEKKASRSETSAAPEVAAGAPVSSTTEDVNPDYAPASVSIAEDRQAIAIQLNQTAGQKETWIPEVEPLPRQEDGPIVTPPLIPLFMPQWTRGILSAAFSTLADEGQLDIERVTELLARGENVERLPTLPALTLGRGVQLLLDKSQAMMPFIRDQAWVLREIRNVVGTNKVEVLRFIGSPLRGAGSGLRPWPAYQPPLPGVQVVLLSDLGIRQPMLAADWADEEEWADFARVVRHAQCPLMALVPYKSARWPRAVSRLMTIVPWDRVTTAATISGLRKTSAGANPA